jgi:hypothetical protein
LINAPPDVVVPTSVANPVQVVVNATNLPPGTAIQVKLTPETGTPTTVGGTLGGSAASSSATVSVALPAGGVSVIRATVTLDVLVALGKPARGSRRSRWRPPSAARRRSSTSRVRGAG